MDGSFEPDTGTFDRFDQLFGNVFVIFLVRLGTCGKRFPLELEAGRFQDAHRRARDLRSDAVAGNECDLMRHLDFGS